MSSTERSYDREPVAAGRFYAADKDVLINDLSGLFENRRGKISETRVRAIISPHAGYVFSGTVAASAYSVIPRDSVYSNIFLIGSSHSMYFEGAAVYDRGNYFSPVAEFKVNKEIAAELMASDQVFSFPVTSHINEHSLEVQLPFMWHVFREKMPAIVPVIIGSNEISIIRKIAGCLAPWFNKENLFIISSDFSHYPSYNDAVETDRRVALSIASGNPDEFLDTLKKNSGKKIKGLATSMCGWTSALTLMFLAEGKKNLHFKLIDYANSGDSAYGEKDRVVGYYAIALTE